MTMAAQQLVFQVKAPGFTCTKFWLTGILSSAAITPEALKRSGTIVSITVELKRIVPVSGKGLFQAFNSSKNSSF